MTSEKQFGPWATMFETGPHARLSTFWKRRMAMLPSTASAERTISRRVGLAVLLAACAALSAPTVYLLRAPQARADEPQAQPFQATPLDGAPAAEPPLGAVDQVIGPPPEDVFDSPRKAEDGKIELLPSIGLPEPQADPAETAPGPVPGQLVPRKTVVQVLEPDQVEVAPGQFKTVERQISEIVYGPPDGAIGPVTVHNPTGVPLAKRIEFLPAPSEQEEVILKKLHEPTTVEFEETPLAQAIDFLRDKHEIEIQLDERGLNEAGIGLDTPVTMHSKNVPLRSVLRRFLSNLDMTYFVEDDALVITSKERADESVVTRTYPVGDLVSNTVAAAAAQPARFGGPPSDEPNAKGGGMGGGGAKRAAIRPPEGYARLVEAITNTITPTSWDDQGGNGAIVVVPESKSLVISQSHAAHDDVVRLLRSLRAARAMADQPQKPVGALQSGQPVPVRATTSAAPVAVQPSYGATAPVTPRAAYNATPIPAATPRAVATPALPRPAESVAPRAVPQPPRAELPGLQPEATVAPLGPPPRY